MRASPTRTAGEFAAHLLPPEQYTTREAKRPLLARALRL